MQSSKKLLLPALVCVLMMILTAASCSTSGGNGSGVATPTPVKIAPPGSQILRYPMQDSDISTFDPALSQDTASDFAIKTVFTGLVEFNDKLQVVDQLATHQVSPDGLVYTFELNPKAKFSDGKPVTAEDVAFSINRALLPATKSAVTSYMGLLKDYDKITTGKINTIIGDSVLVVDPQTIKLVITKPAAYFLATMTYDNWYVVEKSLVNQYGDKWTEHLSQGGGAGPYMVQAWNHTKGIDLVPNPYWYGPAPKIQHIEYYESGNIDTTYKAYQAGQFDYSLIPSQNVPAARGSADFYEYPILVTTYLTMNYLTKPFDNIKIRQAFALAINRDVLNQTLLKNTVSPSWSFIPPGMPGHSNIVGPDGVTSTAGDQQKAAALLKEGMQEAGYTTLPPIKLTYYASSTTVTNYINAIIQMWRTTLGVSVTQQTLDFPKLIDSQTASQNNPNGLQMWRASWQADYADPQDWLSIFFSAKGDDNNMNYGQNNSSAASAQQQIQKSLVAADANQDSTTRLQQYESAEQKIINDAALIPLWQPKNDIAIKTYLKGLTTNGLVIIPPNDWASIYIAQQ